MRLIFCPQFTYSQGEQETL